MSDRPCCKVINRRVYPCLKLEAVIEETGPSGRRKGVFQYELYNLKTGDLTRRFIGIKSGAHLSKGIAMNFCPFCGIRIDGPFNEE